MALLDTNYNPGVQNSSAKYDIAKFDTTGASTNDVVTFDGTDVVWSAGGGGGGITELTGDVTAGPGSGSQAATIAAGVIVNTMVDAAAAIDFSKLASLTSANILVGSAGNVATSVAVSGDATLSNAGAVTVTKINGKTVAQVPMFGAQATTVGGAAAEAITVTGAAATDLAFVQLVDNGTNNVTVVSAAVTLNTLTVTFSADPGNDAIINYLITRAA